MSITDQSYADYTAWLERQPLAARSKQAYLFQIRRYLNWLPTLNDHEQLLPDHTLNRDPRQWQGEVDSVTWAVQNYKEAMLDQGLSAATVNQALSAAHNFYSSRGVQISVDPQRIRRHAPQALDGDEVRTLRRTVSGASPRDRAIVLTFLHTGLRLSELTALRTDDVAITARKGTLTVRVGKGGQSRSVPLNRECRHALQGWLAKRSGLRLRDTTPTDALWISRLGRQMSRRTIGTVVAQAGKAAGLEGVTPHRLRHTFVTRLARGGADPFLISDVAGHSRLETTLSYSRPTAADRDRIVVGILDRS